MAKPDRPTLPFTLRGQRRLIAGALLVAAFLLLLLVYLQWGRVRDLLAELGRPLPYTLVDDRLTVSPDPAAWGAFATIGDDRPTRFLLLREHADGTGALVVLQTTRAPDLAARALDLSPAVLAAKLTASHADLGHAQTVRLLGVEARPHAAGVVAAHFFFDAGDDHGEGILFYVDDVEYLFWGHRGGDGSPALAPFFAPVGGAVTLPEGLRDAFDRPVVDSNALTFAETRAVAEEAERERAAARTAAARDELVPALGHYRKALRLLSSIREEDLLLDSPEADRFRALADDRRRQVDAWFARLDRAVGMGDVEAARAQAGFIRDNATLEGEAPDRLRAEAVLRALPAPKQ